MVQELRLINAHGERLYLTKDERDRFCEASLYAKRSVKSLCQVMHFTGCRASEALSICAKHIDLDNRNITIRTLKKRRVEYRLIPVPDALVNDLDNIYGLRERTKPKELKELLFGCSRKTGYNWVTGVMKEAGIREGAHRTPKGLRHGFAIAALLCEPPVDLYTLSTLMGHSSIETTAAYCKVLGFEKREIVSRMWS